MTEADRRWAEIEKEFCDYLRQANPQGASLAEIAQAVREGAELSAKLEGEWLHIRAVFPEEG